MKKLHQLILRAFTGPFLVVFSVLVLIFLLKFVLHYIEELSGKGLPITTYFELFFYFSFNSIPRILPLAILFSTLMTYGNFGQHNELTAIKSAGVSLVKILLPVFIFTVFISFVSFYTNNNFIPKVNLKAYRLLWDIKHKKAAFNLREGIFYNEIPKYSMKVDKIHKDGKSLNDIIIYDHTERNMGNITHIVADSGYMQLTHNESYMELELFNGKRNSEHIEKKDANSDDYVRSAFSYTKMIFDLSSFQLDETPEELFKNNRQMMTVAILQTRIDSTKLNYIKVKDSYRSQISTIFKYNIEADTIPHKLYPEYKASSYDTARVLRNAFNRSKNLEYQTLKKKEYLEGLTREVNTFKVEQLHKYSEAVACIIMFLIGAPIGAVLKKGGLGFPGIITIAFFIIYYVIFITFEKYARADLINVYVGSWGAIFTLLPFGIFFVYQASIDSSLFEIDLETKFSKWFKKRTKEKS